jgi:hypothetical protein
MDSRTVVVMVLHDDGTFELEPEDTDVTDSVMPDDYYEAPAGCIWGASCLIKGEHRVSDCIAVDDPLRKSLGF